MLRDGLPGLVRTADDNDRWILAVEGSRELALAVRAGRVTGQKALDLSRLDEIYQAEQWGDDHEAVTRAANLAIEAAVLERWFAALRR